MLHMPLRVGFCLKHQVKKLHKIQVLATVITCSSSNPHRVYPLSIDPASNSSTDAAVYVPSPTPPHPRVYSSSTDASLYFPAPLLLEQGRLIICPQPPFLRGLP